jgi:hypothetical protein
MARRTCRVNSIASQGSIGGLWAETLRGPTKYVIWKGDNPPVRH